MKRANVSPHFAFPCAHFSRCTIFGACEVMEVGCHVFFMAIVSASPHFRINSTMDGAPGRRASLWTALIKQGCAARSGGVIKAFKHRHPQSLQMSALQRSRGARRGACSPRRAPRTHTQLQERRCEDGLHQPEIPPNSLQFFFLPFINAIAFCCF